MVTVQLWWGLLACAAGVSAAAVAGQIAIVTATGIPTILLSASSQQQSIAASAATGELVAILAGVSLGTADFRRYTSPTTFLLEPRRGRVVLAKLLISGGIGFAYGGACAMVGVTIMAPSLAVMNVTTGWVSNGILLMLSYVVLVVTMCTVAGTGFGLLVRSQPAALIGAAVYLLAIEPLIDVIPFTRWIYPFLPGAAVRAFTVVGSGVATDDVANQWRAMLLLLGWTLCFAIGGWALLIRRDIP